jgi:hypothetical protein
MAKDPAFLFYPGDYIAGTMHLDFVCKGAYIDLLMLQFNRGHMTIDMIKHMLGDKYAQVWGQIKDKFLIETEKGIDYYYNERLRIEKQKRQNYVKSRINNKSGVNQYKKSSKKQNGHMTEHMEDVNENEIISKKEIIYPFETEKFKNAWELWKQYKFKEFKFKYKSSISEQAALSNLNDLSGNNENIAYAIMKRSVENGWKGFFELKKKSNTNNSQMQDYKQQIIDEINATR